MIDICPSYLVVRLREHYLAEALEAGLDRQLDTRELPSIGAYALL